MMSLISRRAALALIGGSPAAGVDECSIDGRCDEQASATQRRSFTDRGALDPPVDLLRKA